MGEYVSPLHLIAKLVSYRKAYVLSNILVEIFWNTIMAVLVYFCWFYPVGFTQNMSADDVHIRGFLIFLFSWMFMLFVSTFSHLCIAALETPDMAGALATLIWVLCIAFCGYVNTHCLFTRVLSLTKPVISVGVAKADLPGFWIFMYRLSPATYLVSGVLSTALSGSKVICAPHEILRMQPPGNMTCGEYMGDFMRSAGGYLLDEGARDQCEYCKLSSTDDYLATVDIYYEDRWRNFGLLWVYVGVNIVGALAVYWLFRVPKTPRIKKGEMQDGKGR